MTAPSSTWDGGTLIVTVGVAGDVGVPLTSAATEFPAMSVYPMAAAQSPPVAQATVSPIGERETPAERQSGLDPLGPRAGRLREKNRMGDERVVEVVADGNAIAGVGARDGQDLDEQSRAGVGGDGRGHP